MHGGSIGQVKRAAQRRLIEARAASFLGDYERSIPDPLAEFQTAVVRMVAFRDYLEAQVTELTSLGYSSEIGTEQIRAAVQLYERALERAGAFLERWVRLGMDERLTRVEEAKAQAIISAFERATAPLSEAQRGDVRAAFVRELRVLDGGAA